MCGELCCVCTTHPVGRYYVSCLSNSCSVHGACCLSYSTLSHFDERKEMCQNLPATTILARWGVFKFESDKLQHISHNHDHGLLYIE